MKIKGFYEQINKTSIFALFLDGKVEDHFATGLSKMKENEYKLAKTKGLHTLFYKRRSVGRQGRAGCDRFGETENDREKNCPLPFAKLNKTGPLCRHKSGALL